MKPVRILITLSGLWAALFFIARCGSDAGASLSSALSGIESLPSVASMVKGSGANGSYANLHANSFTNHLLSLHVSGTPPKLSEITSAKVDTYFWNGLLATLKNTSAGSITEAQRTAFYGGTVDGPGGHGTCFQAQSVGESMDRMVEAGMSMCYMRNIPKQTSGITVSSGAVADIFKLGAEDKIIKAAITGEGEGQSEDIFIKVHGSASAGSNYNVDLWFCRSGTVRGYENIRINKDTGVFTASHTGKESWEGSDYVFASTVSAALTAPDGNVAFDTSKDRTATAFFGKVGGSGSETGVYKGEVVITPADWMYAKRYNKYSFRDHNNVSQSSVDKNFSISAFSGDTLKNLRFLQAAFMGAGTWGSDSHTYSGASEFRDTHYVAIASSDLKTEADKVSLSTDSFYANLTPPTVDASSYSCTATPTITVTIDMSNAGMQAVSASCEADRFRDYSMCWSSDIQAVQQKLNERF